MRLSVVIPCYNETATVTTVVERVARAAALAPREIIAVDDASTDGTALQLRRLMERPDLDCELRVLTHRHNQGKGAALRTGFAAARGEIIVVQDADLEYNPTDLPDLLRPIVEGVADVVYGSRFVGSKYHRTQYFSHYVGNRSLTLLSNVATGLNLTDVYTGYKAFRREVLEGLELRENDYGFEQEFTCKVARRGYRIYEVGISYAGRTFAEGKKIKWTDGLRGLRNLAVYGFMRR